MVYDRRILDRQVGRNAQLFAEATGALPSAEERFPYVRILVALIENAHPEWSQAPQKPQQVADACFDLVREIFAFELHGNGRERVATEEHALVHP